MQGHRLVRLAAQSGLVGPGLFAAVLLGLTLAQYDFMLGLGWHPLDAPTFDWPSGLALGPFGWLMTAAFALSGALIALFGWGLGAALTRGRAGRLGAALMCLAGLAMVGLSFTTDPTLRTTPGTWHGRIHDLSFVALGLTLFPSMIALGLAFRTNAGWNDFTALTFGALACAAPAFALKGAAFYLFLALILVWITLVARRLGQVSAR